MPLFDYCISCDNPLTFDLDPKWVFILMQNLMYLLNNYKLKILFKILGIIPYYEGMPFCVTLPRYHHFMNIVGNVDAMITMIIPFFIIVILNGLILCTVLRSKAQREKHLVTRTESDPECAKNSRRNSNISLNISCMKIGLQSHLGTWVSQYFFLTQCGLSPAK